VSKSRLESGHSSDADIQRSALRRGGQPGPSLEDWLFVTPGDLLRSIRRRLPSLLLTTVVVASLVVGLLVVWPNRYSSEGLMYVRLGRGALAVDPTMKTSQSVSLQESRTAEVISIGEMIRSREIAERVVDRVGVESINRPRTWPERAAEKVKRTLGSERPATGMFPEPPGKAEEWSPEKIAAQLERERAVRDVLDSLEVKVVEDGYTITVAAHQQDPWLAQAVVQAVMDEFGKYYVKAHRSEGSEAFFEAQAAASRQAALQAREILQNTQNEMGWLSAESAETALRERIIDLEINLNAAESQLAEAVSKADELERRLAETSRWVPTEVTSGIANVAGDQLRSQLYDVQIEDGEELANLSPNHPRYRRLRQKMEESQSLAEAERNERTERTEAINPVYIELDTQLQSAHATAVGLRSRRDALQARLDVTAEDLQRLNRDRTTLARLTWEAELSEEIYRDHALSLEEARINAKLDEQHMSDVSVIQPATLNLKKSGPPRGILSVVGVLLGLSLGILQAIVRDPPMVRSPGRPLASSYQGLETRERYGVDSVPSGNGDAVLSENIEKKNGFSPSEITSETTDPEPIAVANGSGELSHASRNLPR